MKVAAVGIEWDDGNREKCRKHGVSLGEIETLLSGDPKVAPDPRHSASEDRLIAIGKTAAGRALFVAFTIRSKEGRNFIRAVSARYMHKKEFEAYEKKGS
jgi:uncharacterized DUF497 family protein